MQLAIGPHLVSGSWDESSPKESKHSGRQLRRGTFTFSVSENTAEAVRKALSDARWDPREHVFLGDSGSRWAVDNFQARFAVSGPEIFDVDLIEAEELDCSSVEFADFRFQPSYFHEFFVDDEMLTSFEVDLDENTSRELDRFIVSRRTEGYFPVRRVGISDEPVSMRFGLCVWQPLEANRRRHLIFLVSEEGDDEHQIEGSAERVFTYQVARRAIKTDTQLELLLDELVRLGVVTEEALERIRSGADNAWRERGRELREVEDVRLHRAE